MADKPETNSNGKHSHPASDSGGTIYGPSRTVTLQMTITKAIFNPKLNLATIIQSLHAQQTHIIRGALQKSSNKCQSARTYWRNNETKYTNCCPSSQTVLCYRSVR